MAPTARIWSEAEGECIDGTHRKKEDKKKKKKEKPCVTKKKKKKKKRWRLRNKVRRVDGARKAKTWAEFDPCS